MPYLGNLATYQCTQCGAKHQKVIGSRVVFLLDENNKVIKHGDGLYLSTCDCRNQEHRVIGIGYEKNTSVHLWRDMSGNLHDPSTMSIDYIFNVFLMIWNHSVPCHMRAHLPPYNRYTKFPKCYNKVYMKEMFHVMYERLVKQGDFGTTPLQRGLIAFVEKWLDSGQCDFMKKKVSNV